MKKLITGLLVSIITLLSFSSAFAQVVQDDNQDNVDCTILTYNLKLGSRDASTNGDVSRLQTYLSQANYLDSDPTGYYGNATKRAVKLFQRDYSISPTGNIGAYSRSKIKEVSCGANNYPLNPAPAQTQPVTILITPVTTNPVTQVSALPSCIISTDKSSYKLGETVTFSWTSKNATYAAFYQDVSGKDRLLLPGDKLNTYGSQAVTANAVGNPEVTLLVYSNTGSGSCKIQVPVSYGAVVQTEPFQILTPAGGKDVMSGGTHTVCYTGKDSYTRSINISLVKELRTQDYPLGTAYISAPSSGCFTITIPSNIDTSNYYISASYTLPTLNQADGTGTAFAYSPLFRVTNSNSPTFVSSDKTFRLEFPNQGNLTLESGPAYNICLITGKGNSDETIYFRIVPVEKGVDSDLGNASQSSIALSGCYYKFNIPVGISGNYVIQASNSSKTLTATSPIFKVRAEAKLTSISSTSLKEGDTLTLYGENIDSASYVSFGGAKVNAVANYQSYSSSYENGTVSITVKVTVPYLPAGSYPVYISRITPYGIKDSNQIFVNVN